MKSLSEVSISIKPIAEQSIRSSDTSSTQVHGSITEAGRMNTQSNRLNQSRNEEAAKQKKPQSGECLELKTPISDCLESKKKLTLLVKSCFEALNTYGGGNDALEASIMLMQMTLGRFDYETVRAAFGKHLQYSSDMPKPADIIRIIEPPTLERKWCKVTFLEIKRKKRENVFTSIDEDNYIRDFVAAQITAPEEERGLIEGAIRHEALEHKQYWLE